MKSMDQVAGEKTVNDTRMPFYTRSGCRLDLMVSAKPCRTDSTKVHMELTGSCLTLETLAPLTNDVLLSYDDPEDVRDHAQEQLEDESVSISYILEDEDDEEQEESSCDSGSCSGKLYF